MYYTSRLMGAVESAKSGKYARYIRNYINGSNQNTGNHYNEIMAFSDGVNVALNKDAIDSESNSAPAVVDGKITAMYSQSGGLNKFVEIDLGDLYTISHITMWHYYLTGIRIYKENVLQISDNGVNWTTVFDSEVDGRYLETEEGKTIYL